MAFATFGDKVSTTSAVFHASDDAGAVGVTVYQDNVTSDGDTPDKVVRRFDITAAEWALLNTAFTETA